MNKLKLLGLTALTAVGLVAGANAQNWANREEGKANVRSVVINSATVITRLPINIEARAIRVIASATTGPVTTTLSLTNRFGTVLEDITLPVSGSSVVSVTLPWPHFFTQMRVSNTTALTGTNALHVTVVQPEFVNPAQ